MKKPDNRCRELVEKISSLLKREIALSDDAIHYIDSTFSDPSVETLRTLAADADGGEIESLYELVFFPDESMQMELEGMLQKGKFTEKDEDTLCAMLKTLLPETPVRFPENRGNLYLRMPEWAIRPFVSRLRVNRNMDRRISEAIETYIPEKERDRIRIKFRNSRFNQTNNRIDFLCTYFKILKADCNMCLDFMIGLFEASEDTPDIYSLLMERKQQYFQGIIKGLRHEQMLIQHNMETLLMQGVRMPYVDRSDFEQKMQIIDRIGLAVFGKTEYFQKPEEILAENDYRVAD